MVMSDDWGGKFLPLVKHDLGTGDIRQHVKVVSITQLDDDEIADYDEDSENDMEFEDLLQLGDGPVQYLVSVLFSGEGPYDYVVWGPADEAEMQDYAFELMVKEAEINRT
jgi:hypothetical protein